MIVTLVIVGGVGVCFLARAGYDVWSSIRMRRVGVRAAGRVIGHDRISTEGSDNFKAVVRFTDGDGVVRDFRAYGQHASPHPPEGTAVPVVFLPDGSRSPQIALPLYVLDNVLLFLWMGGIFLGGAVLFAVVGPDSS